MLVWLAIGGLLALAVVVGLNVRRLSGLLDIREDLLDWEDASASHRAGDGK